MPAFDLKYIQAAPYSVTEGKAQYGKKQTLGAAMTANLSLTFAEGRLYAESSLAEFMRKATGGSISIGTKELPVEAQKMLYGAKDSSRNVGEKTVAGLKFGNYSTGQYVGVSCYSPSMVDGVEKFDCVFVTKALFGPPSMTRQTLGQNIVFDTPTTTGEFMKDANGDMFEIATVDDEATAKAWCDTVLEASA